MKFCIDCKFFSDDGRNWEERKLMAACTCPHNELGDNLVYGNKFYRFKPSELRHHNLECSQYSPENHYCGPDAVWFKKKDSENDETSQSRDGRFIY
jgi:hypothetical protein